MERLEGETEEKNDVIIAQFQTTKKIFKATGQENGLTRSLISKSGSLSSFSLKRLKVKVVLTQKGGMSVLIVADHVKINKKVQWQIWIPSFTVAMMTVSKISL